MPETATMTDERAEAARMDSGSAQPLLEIDRLCVSFGGVDVLREITLQIQRGQTLVVIGESGCGKTVLLKTIIGLVSPTKGAIRFEGTRSCRFERPAIDGVEKSIRICVSTGRVFDSLTIGQNVAFPLRQHRNLSDAEVRNGYESHCSRWGCQRRWSSSGPLKSREDEETRWLGPCARHGSRVDLVRRANNRTRSDHERRNQ